MATIEFTILSPITKRTTQWDIHTLTERVYKAHICDYDLDCKDDVTHHIKGLHYCFKHSPDGNHIYGNDCKVTTHVDPEGYTTNHEMPYLYGQ